MLELPFYNLSELDFMREIHSNSATLLNDETIMSKDLYADIIECPDRNENYDDQILHKIESKYFDMKQTSKYLQKITKAILYFTQPRSQGSV
jgi:hypothetical protein